MPGWVCRQGRGKGRGAGALTCIGNIQAKVHKHNMCMMNDGMCCSELLQPLHIFASYQHA